MRGRALGPRVTRVGGGGALDGDRVGQAAFGQAQAKAGGIAVTGIGDHRQVGQFPLVADLVEHPRAGLGGAVHVLRLIAANLSRGGPRRGVRRARGRPGRPEAAAPGPP